MNVANISYARNHLSELINRVRDGESILIMDRQVAVAQLDAPANSGRAQAGWKADLVRRGILCPAKCRMNAQAIIDMPIATPQQGGDPLVALLAEREESR